MINADADTTGVRADIVDAIGNGLAEFLVDEVMHIDVERATLLLIIAASVLVFADQFLLLGVDRDHRLAGGLMRFDLRVDVLELRVAIGMASAFLALAIDLTPIAEAFEQLGNPARGNAMSHVAQRRGEFGVAFRHPQQRSHRIAERRRLEQPPQVFQQRRIFARQRQPSAAGASNFLSGDGRRQISQPTIDGAARYSRRPRNRGNAAKPRRARLRRREQATPSFVETRAQSFIPLPNRRFINHAAVINQLGSPKESRQTKSIQLFCGVAIVVRLAIAAAIKDGLRQPMNNDVKRDIGALAQFEGERLGAQDRQILGDGFVSARGARIERDPKETQ